MFEIFSSYNWLLFLVMYGQVCAKALRRLQKDYDEGLDKEYATPKSNKGYKGSSLPPILIPPNAAIAAKRSSVVKVLLNTPKVQQPVGPTQQSISEIEENVPAPVAAPVVLPVAALPAPTKEIQLVRRYIPYTVMIAQGAPLKSHPSNFTLGGK